MQTIVRNYKDLIVWRKAMDLAELVYAVTENFPKSELYGLVSQMRRCCVSIPSNIAEGSRRGSRRDFRQFVIVAFASGAELETQSLLARRLAFLPEREYSEVSALLEEIMKMLHSLISKLQTTY